MSAQVAMSRRPFVRTGIANVLGRLLIGIMFAALLGCATDGALRVEPVPQQQPARQAQAYSSPEAQGIDSRDLVEVLERARREKIALHSLIIARHGAVVLELYVPPYGPDISHNIKSVTKSVVSALTGVALERGCLPSLDTPVADLLSDEFKRVTDPRKRDITVRHLLTMTAGLDLDENGPKTARIVASNDWVGATLARPLIATPGETFLYASPLSHLLGVAISRSCGVDLVELCRSSVCGALEIDRITWRKTPRGDYFGAADLYLRPRDMLSFGSLFLDEGHHGGHPVVSRDWVHESIRNQVADITMRSSYGFGWWPVEHGYKATGWGGQRIWVVPSQDLVIVATMAAHDGFETMFDGFDISRLSDNPLPERYDARQALATELAEWRRPALQGDVSDLALSLSGQVFMVDSASTTASLRGLKFEFPAGSDARLSLWNDSKRDVLAVGLDGIYRISPTSLFSKNENGQVAVRGRWSAENRFDIELAPLGEPVRLSFSATFLDDRMTFAGISLPDQTRVSLKAFRSAHESLPKANSDPMPATQVPSIEVRQALSH